MAPLPRLNKPNVQENQITITADRVLKASELPATVFVNSTTSRIITLPPAFKGARVRVVTTGLAASGVGHLIKVANSSNAVRSKVSATGAHITSPTGGKGIVNTQASAVLGDFITLESDGTDWFSTAIGGTWAREA